MDTNYDNQFLAIEGLTWLPWVGDNYANGTRRLLIVAESHYVNGEGDLSQDIKEVIDNHLFTREVVQECPINGDWGNNMFANLHRTLFLNESFNSASFWDNVAFYNFVQRPMDYSRRERPNDSDLFKGWSAFIPLVDILKPTDCLFIGVSASNFFELSMSALGVEHSQVQWLEGSSSAYGRRFSITRGWGSLPILGIQHTSQYYSYELWHHFLMIQNRSLLRYIYSLAGLNLSPAIMSVNKPRDNSWLERVPSRNHKSILACEYSKVEYEGTDALYLTVGRAQYDNISSASVKCWRWSNNRWSRQSEEVPIERVGDMALMLVSAIKTFQTLDYGSSFTYLKEDFINEGDMSFLKKSIMESAPRIRESLSELKRLLNEVDLNKL